MAVSQLYLRREELKKLVSIAGLSQEEKKRWTYLIPQMLPSEMLKLKRNLLQQLLVDSQFEAVDEIVKTKKAPKDDLGILEMVLAKVLTKVDQVEVRTGRARGE